MRKYFIIILILSGIGGMGYGQGFVQMVLNQPPVLKADAGKDTTCCKGHPVTLGGESSASGGSGYYTYLWSPVDGLDNPTAAHPVAVPDSSKTYTLTVTDTDGCQSVSLVNLKIDLCLGVDYRTLSSDLIIFPNPSAGKFKIGGISTPPGKKLNLEIMNQLGQVVYFRDFASGDILEGQEIDTQITEPGVYFLKLSSPDQLISRRLIIR